MLKIFASGLDWNQEHPNTLTMPWPALGWEEAL
jgi:hypothetical protein